MTSKPTLAEQPLPHVAVTLVYMYIILCICAIFTHPGTCKEENEVCLDCRSQAAEHVVQQCHVNGHEATVVVYNDTERREFVPVYRPVIASRQNVKFVVNIDHLTTCHDRTECSVPHHYLEAGILNVWRENTVLTSTKSSLVRVTSSINFNTRYICYLNCIFIHTVLVLGRVKAGSNSL